MPAGGRVHDGRMSDTDATVTDLAAVRAEIARLQGELDRLERLVVDPPPTSSRRGLLKLAGATAAGAVASAAVAGRAAADMGYTNTGIGSGAPVVGDVVRQQLNGSRQNEVAFLFSTVSSPLLANNQDGDGAALGGFAIDGLTAVGVKGRSSFANGTGVLGDATGASGTGVRGDGLVGVTGNGRGAGNVGVVGTGLLDNGGGVQGIGAAFGVRGQATQDTGVGVDATASSTGGIAVDGFGGRYGARLRGGTAALRLVDASTPPSATLVAHEPGEITYADGDLWLCVEAGTPGTWRKLGGAGTAGAFHPLSGGRVYDSREPLPAPGPLSGGENRTISIASARTTTGGNVVIPDYIPAGARAIAANVTVVSVSGGGFLACNPGGVTSVVSSTINWSAPNQVFANGVILTVINRELTVVAGGGSAHFVVDVSGYWL